jgi:hypothetical protein
MGNVQRRTKGMEMKFLEKTVDGFYLFQMVYHASRFPRIFTAVANTSDETAFEAERLMIKELPFAAERRVMEKMWPRIDEAHRCGRRCLVWMDISDFPLVGCSIDERDQQQVHPEREGRKEFWEKVVHMWLQYDLVSEVAAVIVNANISHMGLKTFWKYS